MTQTDISEILNKKIEDIKKKVISRDIILLDLELVPLFNELKDSLTVNNLNLSTETYKTTCSLLNQKFDELKDLLTSTGSDKIFSNYIKLNPSDLDILNLLNDCWIQEFTIDCLSFEYLELSRSQLGARQFKAINIKHLRKSKVNEDFLLEIPMRKFTERMMRFYQEILKKLPCEFNEIFGDELRQEIIYEKFVYILHLLQLGKLKYLKETNVLYL
ncbi:MAG: hypothetical protein ACFFAO_16925 [Candidatus Hermodarchaeota archaeon]